MGSHIAKYAYTKHSHPAWAGALRRTLQFQQYDGAGRLTQMNVGEGGQSVTENRWAVGRPSGRWQGCRASIQIRLPRHEWQLEEDDAPAVSGGSRQDPAEPEDAPFD